MTIIENTKAATFQAVHRALVAAALIILLGMTAACGGSGNAEDDALPDAPGSSTSAPSGDDEADLEPEDAMLKFTQCMREHGIDMEDPKPGGGVFVGGEGVDPDQMETAEQACQKWMDMAMPEDAGEELSEEEKQAFLDTAACMRERGYDFPDPTFDGGRVTQKIEKGDSGLPGPDDPSFQKDMEECSAEAGLEPPQGDSRGSDERQG